MIKAFINTVKIPELRRKILFTFGLIFVCRLGSHIPTAGIDGFQLSEYFKSLSKQGGGTLFNLMDLFSGGAMNRCTVFALGIMPYISASIILQLLTGVIPHLSKLMKEGESGRQKIIQYTRYGTVFLALFQAFFISMWLEHFNFGGKVIVYPDIAGWQFRILTMITLTAGTIFLMWLGEQITEYGIGQGISLIITVGIISRLPTAITQAWRIFTTGERNPMLLVVLLTLLIFVTAAVILILQGERRIPIQYAKRVVGRKVYQGQNTFFPLKVTYANVIPIIFASSMLLFPATIGSFVKFGVLRKVSQLLMPGRLTYEILYATLIIFFTYFWTAVQFDPIQISEDMKRSGAFIPGIRPGRATADYFDMVMTRITLSGAFFLALVAVLPSIISSALKVPFRVASFFGGTALLIMVGVILDTVKQVESQLTMRHYEGFLKHGKIKGRRNY